MHLTGFILCESARVRPDGTFDVVHGGYSEAVAPAFPTELTISAVVVLEAGPAEAGPQALEVQLRDPDGKPLQAWRHGFPLQPGQKGAHLVLNLRSVRLPAPGDYAFEVRLGGKRLSPVKFLRARKA